MGTCSRRAWALASRSAGALPTEVARKVKTFRFATTSVEAPPVSAAAAARATLRTRAWRPLMAAIVPEPPAARVPLASRTASVPDRRLRVLPRAPGIDRHDHEGHDGVAGHRGEGVAMVEVALAQEQGEPHVSVD